MNEIKEYDIVALLETVSAIHQNTHQLIQLISISKTLATQFRG